MHPIDGKITYFSSDGNVAWQNACLTPPLRRVRLLCTDNDTRSLSLIVDITGANRHSLTVCVDLDFQGQRSAT